MKIAWILSGEKKKNNKHLKAFYSKVKKSFTCHFPAAIKSCVRKTFPQKRKFWPALPDDNR